MFKNISFVVYIQFSLNVNICRYKIIVDKIFLKEKLEFYGGYGFEQVI